jgi:hypothetical protein
VSCGSDAHAAVSAHSGVWAASRGMPVPCTLAPCSPIPYTGGSGGCCSCGCHCDCGMCAARCAARVADSGAACWPSATTSMSMSACRRAPRAARAPARRSRMRAREPLAGWTPRGGTQHAHVITPTKRAPAVSIQAGAAQRADMSRLKLRRVTIAKAKAAIRSRERRGVRKAVSIPRDRRPSPRGDVSRLRQHVFATASLFSSPGQRRPAHGGAGQPDARGDAPQHPGRRGDAAPGRLPAAPSIQTGARASFLHAVRQSPARASRGVRICVLAHADRPMLLARSTPR